LVTLAGEYPYNFLPYLQGNTQISASVFFAMVQNCVGAFCLAVMGIWQVDGLHRLNNICCYPALLLLDAARLFGELQTIIVELGKAKGVGSVIVQGYAEDIYGGCNLLTLNPQTGENAIQF